MANKPTRHTIFTLFLCNHIVSFYTAKQLLKNNQETDVFLDMIEGVVVSRLLAVLDKAPSSYFIKLEKHSVTF